jgi:DNA repair protein RadA/Sms
VSVGFDVNRLHLLVAVIEKRVRIRFGQQDIYLNMAGGMKVTETTPDLAICFSLISSRLEKSLNKNTIYLGEVGLGGEIRPVHFLKGGFKKRLEWELVGWSHRNIISIIAPRKS